MGNQVCSSQGCCAGDEGKATATAADHSVLEATQVLEDSRACPGKEKLDLPPVNDKTYSVMLNKRSGGKLGLDVDFMEGRTILPIMALTGGLAEAWNTANPLTPLQRGDSIVAVNGCSANASAMLDKCKNDTVLELTLCAQLTYEHLVGDLEKLVDQKGCGPLLVRLSWHDAGVFSTGSNPGGCPNAAMRFLDGGESKFGANAGLPEVAIPLLSNISGKYCPDLISHADLWALAANVSIRLMGGPDIATRFGRVDARSSAASVPSQDGRLPDGDKGADHLRQIFHSKGFQDRDIVALSGAHAVGRCHLDRSGFDGAWTADPSRFDNSYFKALVEKSFSPETTSKGKPQYRCAASNTIMLESDMALVQDPSFKRWVDAYAADQDAFFADFSDSWARLQELGWASLRD
ncbi:unnamed protein product, partial [Prorocentrum cordatum]